MKLRERDPEDIRILEAFLNVGLREFSEALTAGDQHLADRWARFCGATYRRIETPQEQDA